MSLLDNRSTWKLVYAWAIVSTLNIKYEDIFDLVTIDVGKCLEKRKNGRESTRDRYNILGVFKYIGYFNRTIQ